MERPSSDSWELENALLEKRAELVKVEEACSALRHECNAIKDTIHILDRHRKPKDPNGNR